MVGDTHFKTAQAADILKLLTKTGLLIYTHNLTISLKIFLISPVSVTLGDRTSEIVKQIKTYDS